jgi:hypothetical protein
MVLARILTRSAALLALALVPTPVRGEAAAPAPSPAARRVPAATFTPGAPGKPAEVRTVGTTPAVLTEAERRKVALAGPTSRRERPPRTLVPPGIRPPAESFETRIPAAGPRDRRKPIQSAEEIAARERERVR